MTELIRFGSILRTALLQEIEIHSTKKYMFSFGFGKSFPFTFLPVFLDRLGNDSANIWKVVLRTNVTSTKQLSLDRLKKTCIRHFFDFILSTFVTHDMLSGLTN